LTGLVDRCEAWPLATSLLAGCSLGRGAADELSDIDAALGVDAPRGEAGARLIGTMEAMVVAALPELGTLVDVLRHPTGPASQHVRRIFAQFADGTQAGQRRANSGRGLGTRESDAWNRTKCRSRSL
jgi:hypothetical protein